MITALKLWGWFRGSLIAQIAAGTVAFLAIWQANNAWERSKGRQQVVQASKQEGKKRNADAEKVRQLANSPGSVDRLRRDYCRDC